MPLRPWRVLSGLAIAIALAGPGGCGGIVGVPPPAASWPAGQPNVMRDPVRIPEVRVEIPSVIAADPEAQRFLLLRQLVEAGLVAPDEAAPRRAANLGALLPYSAPPPASGLARPLALRDVADQLARLSVPVSSAPASSLRAERDFLLDSLLPTEPKTRTPPARMDSAALGTARRRIGDLAGLGLVAPDEQAREMAAITAGEQVLANAPPPPPPAPPPKKKPKKKAASGEAGSKPGDVPGGTVPVNPKGILGLHLLSMASDSMTDKAIDALKKEYPELAPLQFKAVKTDIPDLGTTYRLMAGPMSGTEADQMCKALRAKGQSCAITNF
ncbi:MAG: SPOR domain-containing protein [Magnetospirillum sp.]|nr:SPOR domain-containing protein [Magnetospirillum sp.]